jgi:murein L,D-transpeptidase YafK
MAGLLFVLALAASAWLLPPADASERARAAAARVQPGLSEAMGALSAAPGDPIHLRIFKQESELELWVQPRGRGEFKLFRTYPICAWSGRLGPKTREGDLQAPEGLYSVGPSQLNPNSQFHLSFNLGYPNAYERAQGWTGSALMVHGACVSIGCYAMTDAAIEEIYTLLDQALRSGQSRVAVHAFPFRMEEAQRQRFQGRGHDAFWDLLQAAYQQFESERLPPVVRMDARGYRIESVSRRTVALSGQGGTVTELLKSAADAPCAESDGARHVQADAAGCPAHLRLRRGAGPNCAAACRGRRADHLCRQQRPDRRRHQRRR